MSFKNPEEVKAFAEWAQQRITDMGHYAHTNGLLAGELTGHCVWAMPGRIFIGKIWPGDEKDRTLWMISGDWATPDHIPVELANTAREAARHFALKWQMQAERFATDLAETQTETETDSASWSEVSEQLIERAERLYAIVEQDEWWDEPKQAIDTLLATDKKIAASDQGPDA